jgi:type II secretory pathway pseudopilin PulG
MSRLLRLVHGERGASLVESLVATALLGLALVVLMGSFGTLAIASRDAEQVAAGQGFARAQASRIKAAPYQANGDYGAWYEPVPAGLGRSVATAWWTGASWSATQNANGLERVTITVTGGGRTVARLELLKADR